MTSVRTGEGAFPSWFEAGQRVRARLDLETLAYVLLIGIAVFTRFYDLETRVMSHDESLHTYFSYQLAERGDFEHSPLMHGPLQFHLIGLSYFLFGDSDASARIPAAAASVLSVGLLYLFRRWLGRWGALAGAVLMTVSPFMLYYGRYVRNEALVVPSALLMFYAVFRYFETRQARWLYLLSAALALHFTAKETAFIYAAQLMLFLGAFMAWGLLRERWRNPRLKAAFAAGLVAVFAGVVAVSFGISVQGAQPLAGTAETVEPLDPSQSSLALAAGLSPVLVMGGAITALGVVLASASALLAKGRRLRTDFPAFDVLIITGTVVLPQLAAFPATALGWDPIAYEDPTAVNKTALVVIGLLLLSVVVGWAWDWQRWLISMGVFFGIFAFFYTTVLTHPFGFFTGLVGSLGYWIQQHEVNRGSQPIYYYLLIQIPFYEFLPAVGALMAAALGLRRWRDEAAPEPSVETDAAGEAQSRFPVPAFLGYWALTATVAYTLAGERMPWLTVHIALPYILLAGWAIGHFVTSFDWQWFSQRRGWLVGLLSLFLLLSLGRMVGYLLGAQPPFQGSELSQLRVTTGFLTALFVAGACAAGLAVVAQGWSLGRLAKLSWMAVLALLFLATARTAFRAAFVNYDRATEYMVYAHSATGVKTVMDEVRELSIRTTDGLSMDLGYDDDVSWPFSWYLRNYTQAHFYGANPGRDLLNYPVVIAGDNNWTKVEPILGNRYYTFEYIRMWWPMQEYFNLTWERVWNAIRSPDYRSAIWDIWLNRDYEAYYRLTGKDFAIERWDPADRMRLYIRKDMASLIWDYGVTSASLGSVSLEDPYEENSIQLAADLVLGASGVELGQFSQPRDVALGPDGSVYVADTGNHRVQRLGADGEPQAAWGQFGDAEAGLAFNEPWGLAVAQDGSVYVADTWNHRIVHLSATGELLTSFGSFGQGETLLALWGPRAVALDDAGRVFVADTGNKRIVVFDGQGTPLTSIGGGGAGLGRLDEPVGIALGPGGRLYVADTWNQRVQVFEESQDGLFEAVHEWPIDGWYSESLNNKPYLAVSDAGHVCVSDPEGYRVLCFDGQGDFLTGWGDFGAETTQFGLPSGLAFGAEGGLWVVDSGNHRLMHFQPPLP